MREKRWVFAPVDRTVSAHLAHSLNISALAATLLVNRGVREPADARGFLKPELGALIDPLRFNDMAGAVDRLEAAVKGREKTAIFGDYDVDGTSGSAILIKLFAFLDCPVTWRVPHRVNDGYGLNAAAVEAFASEGVRLLITIDCGTNDVEEIALARERGMDVIVLDHHEPGAVLPPAVAIINPKLKGSTYGFTEICSAGISFKTAWALAERMGARRRSGFEGFILDAMALAAMGTVADVCPLVGENRVIVHYGLDALRGCKGKGLRALLELARLGEKPIDTFDVGFKIAPRLNALGRLGTAMDCVELLVSDDPVRIGEILALAEKSNRHRKEIGDEMFEQAVAQVEAQGGPGAAIILADARWHLGIVGIVAARLVDRYHRPAFVLAIANGLARGSARSIQGLALHEALEACGKRLVTHGGHAMAAGLSLKTSEFESFCREMERHVARLLAPELLLHKLDVDDEVSIGAITRPVVRELERLAPHGPGNPVPVLAASHVKVAGEPRLMGKKNDHLSFYIKQDGVSIRAVGFGMGEILEPLRKARSISVAFTPHINSWKGSESVEIHLEDLKVDA
jgi:single-stranded-DNA-specific exonuclease